MLDYGDYKLRQYLREQERAEALDEEVADRTADLRDEMACEDAPSDPDDVLADRDRWDEFLTDTPDRIRQVSRIIAQLAGMIGSTREIKLAAALVSQCDGLLSEFVALREGAVRDRIAEENRRAREDRT